MIIHNHQLNLPREMSRICECFPLISDTNPSMNNKNDSIVLFLLFMLGKIENECVY